MKTIYNKPILEIKNIISAKAKFQKVMILYDNNILNEQLLEIYSQIKNLCIYNSMNINNINADELYNGYRVVIYFCEASSLLTINFNMEEFINIFCPLSKDLLPFYLAQSKLQNCESFLILEKQPTDLNTLSSMYLNSFLCYFESVINFEHPKFDINNNLSFSNIQQHIENLANNQQFYDIEILKTTTLEYSNLVFLDLLIINAFIVLIFSIKNKQITMVDIYKSAKENYTLIDKFYSIATNNIAITAINLNHNSLYNYAIKTKEQILECFSNIDIDNNIINEAILKLKDYSKNSNNIFSYLYLYNIFEF